MNYLASPPLVVAYALAGTMDIDLVNEPIGEDLDGKPVYLREIWPTQKEIHDTIASAVDSEMFRKSYADVFTGNEQWTKLDAAASDLFQWDADSTYVKHPPYFENMGSGPRSGRESCSCYKKIRNLSAASSRRR